jgi:hypothetical protein
LYFAAAVMAVGTLLLLGLKVVERRDAAVKMQAGTGGL